MNFSISEVIDQKGNCINHQHFNMTATILKLTLECKYLIKPASKISSNKYSKNQSCNLRLMYLLSDITQ